MHFQAYLLEGLMRRTADRASDAVSTTTKGPETYSGALYHFLNALSDDVLGKKSTLMFRTLAFTQVSVLV